MGKGSLVGTNLQRITTQLYSSPLFSFQLTVYCFVSLSTSLIDCFQQQQLKESFDKPTVTQQLSTKHKKLLPFSR